MSKAKKSDQAKQPSRARTCGKLAAIWPTLPPVPAEEARRFERELKTAKRRFLPITPIEAGDPMAALASSAPAGYPPK
jgi:hypothetical protein